MIVLGSVDQPQKHSAFGWLALSHAFHLGWVSPFLYYHTLWRLNPTKSSSTRSHDQPVYKNSFHCDSWFCFRYLPTNQRPFFSARLKSHDWKMKDKTYHLNNTTAWRICFRLSLVSPGSFIGSTEQSFTTGAIVWRQCGACQKRKT